MKKSFMTRALAMGLSLAMAFSLSAATNVSVASAAATPAMASKQFAVRVGGAAKSYKASTATQKSFKITKATVGNTDKATVKVNSSKKSIKVTPGTVTGSTVVTVTFKNIKTAKSTAKKYRCVVKEALEPEKPVEPEVVKATKITEAAPASAKTVSVTFDGAVDTTSATAIKLTRGTTAITVAAKYADDAKSVVLTSDTTLAAGTYTVTVGSFEPVSFNVVKQTPTTMKIVNSTIANEKFARVYFQVLDQYGDVMENYTDKASKLTVSAYNVTKGHKIDQQGHTNKDYFQLNCSTETVASGSTSYLNTIGDKVSIVVYLTDNAAVSCTAELEIVRVYTNELTFGDVKLGSDKRVTEGRTYELAYTAKTNEGNDVTFDEHPAETSSTATTTIDNYNFISSNVAAIDMKNVTVDSDGKLKFVAGTEGTAVITAINTITGETSSTTIVVNKTARLSQVDIADASVACNAASGTTFKAAVTAYDQFGEVIPSTDVKNVIFNANGSGSHSATDYFNTITASPNDGDIHLKKITSDGKYVEYYVNSTPGTTKKNRTITFNFVSKAMGATGYIKSSSTVTIDDEIETSALEIVKAPDATVSEGKDVKLQIAVKDQYQNKISNGGSGFTFNGCTLSVKETNDVIDLDVTPTIGVVNGETDVYEITLKAGAVSVETHKTGSFTVQLTDGLKVIASKTFDLTVVDTIDGYTVLRDKDTYKAGETIKVEVNAYSNTNSKFNGYYNGSVSANIIVSQAAVTKNYTKTLTFKNGVANFELTAGKENNNYEIIVSDKNGSATGTSDKFNVVKNDAGKLILNSNGKLQITDSQENPIGASARDTFATIKVMDDTKNADITWAAQLTSSTGQWDKKDDNTVEVHINSSNIVESVTVGADLKDYDFGNLFVTVPDTSKNNIIVLSITIDGFTWEKKIDANGSTSADFSDNGSVGYRYTAQVKAMHDADAIVAAIKTVSGSTLTASISTASADAITATGSSVITSGTGIFSVSDLTSDTTVGFSIGSGGAVLANHEFKTTYEISATRAEGTGTNQRTVKVSYIVTVTYKARTASAADWAATFEVSAPTVSEV